MSDWGSLQGMTAEIEAAAAKALAASSGAPGAADAAGMQPADVHMQMRWALLLQDQVRQVQQYVQREQSDCSRLHAANLALRKELEQTQPNHPLLAAATASAPPPPSMPPPAALGAAAPAASATSSCACAGVAAAAASAAAASAASLAASAAFLLLSALFAARRSSVAALRSTMVAAVCPRSSDTCSAVLPLCSSPSAAPAATSSLSRLT